MPPRNNLVQAVRRCPGARAGPSRASRPRAVAAAHPSTPVQQISRRSASTTASSPLEESTQRTNPAPGPPKPNTPFTIFDRSAKVLQRDRAAVKKGGEQQEKGGASRLTDYVRLSAAQNISERLLDIRRQFDTIVEVGSGPGYLRQFLDVEGTGVKKIIMCDSSREMLYRDEHLDSQYPFEIERRVIDEEELPFEEGTVDCVVSSGALHWTNDLPGVLIQIQRSLKPDGVFVGAMYGGDTLFELRTSLQLAEQEREGGISPRISPMTDTRDCASLLARAGFNIPTVDVDEVCVAYPSMFELMQDLRDMGESNAVINRRPLLRRDSMLAASAIYSALHGYEDGTVPATFGVIYLIGWKPDPTQAKPLERGSASHSMKEILGTENPDAPEGPPPQGGVPPPPGGGKTRSFSTSARSHQASTSEAASAQQKVKACPACQATSPLEAVTCSSSSCGHLLAIPSDISYYRLLLSTDHSSLPQSGFSIDAGALKAQWRKKQAVSHPDRMHNRSSAEQDVAAQQSSLLNKAYETLTDPLARAHYLLELNGIPIPSEADSLDDAEILMTVMEMRENLEEASTESDIEPIAEENQTKYDETVALLGEAFEKGDWAEAARLVVGLRYWSNIRKVCREWTPGKPIELQH